MHTEVAIPTEPEAVDAAWMDAALADLPERGGARVVAVEFVAEVGTGQMGINARYALTWDRPDGLPATVMAKYPTVDVPTRTAAFANNSYWNEWNFYRHLAGTVRVRAPRCHLARLDVDAQNFVLLMEDLIGSEQGDQMRGLTPDEAALGVEQLVALHAPRWGDESLAQLVTRSPEESAAMLQMIYAGCMEGTLQRLGAALGPALDAEVVQLVRDLAPHVGTWVTGAQIPPTLVHMDFRPDNLLFGTTPDAPPLAVVDWQTTTAGPATHDLAYLIGGAFEADARAEVERDLVTEYRERLAADRVELGATECWHEYRRSTLWGVVMSVVATMLAEQTERGDVMLGTMLRRHAHHALELEALDLVR